jgi:SAM-dependent methyltransferase
MPGAIHVEGMKRQACEIFDARAIAYAAERERAPYFRAQLGIVLSMLAGQRGRILDLGCGSGAEIQALRGRGFSVVAIDFSPSMLEFASRRFADEREVQFCRADIELLPILSQSIDHVVCLGVFEYLPDYREALREIYRVLRPGGLAVFAIPSRISQYNISQYLVSISVGPLWRGAKRILGRKPTNEIGGYFQHNRCVPWRYRALLRRYGFEPERSRYSNFFIYPLNRSPKLNVRVQMCLEPLAAVPILGCAACVYLISARRKQLPL